MFSKCHYNVLFALFSCRFRRDVQVGYNTLKKSRLIILNNCILGVTPILFICLSPYNVMHWQILPINRC